MILTPRCMNLFRLLIGAEWLFTSQIRRRFFPNASPDAVRKRLRKHVEHGYLTVFRSHRMQEAMFSLGPEAKRVLHLAGSVDVQLHRKPPRQLEHFTGINDLRIAAELTGKLSYFFACWELAAMRWQQAVTPDALCEFGDEAFAFEYDRGMEGVNYFANTKVPLYERGLDGVALTSVVVVTDSPKRMENLVRAISATRQTFLFSTLEQVRTQGVVAPIFHRSGQDEQVRLI